MKLILLGLLVMFMRRIFAVQNTEWAGTLHIKMTVDCDMAQPASDFLCCHSWTEISKFWVSKLGSYMSVCNRRLAVSLGKRETVCTSNLLGFS